jgi:hypothetical protein
VILLDANVFMYAAGAEHPNKAPSVATLEQVAEDKLEAAVNAEVLQEILHRYRAIGRWHEGRSVFDLARRIVPEVLPVTADVLDEARTILDAYPGLMARDALHAAVVRIGPLEAICSFDRDFDVIEGLRRFEPE